MTPPGVSDTDLLASSYEALFAIFEAAEDRQALPQPLQDALAQHQPLLGELANRVAP